MRCSFVKNLQRRHHCLHHSAQVHTGPVATFDPFPFSDSEDDTTFHQKQAPSGKGIHAYGFSSLLKPPFHDKPEVLETFINNPRLACHRPFPVLNACLPSSSLLLPDHEWMNLHLPDVKKSLGLPLTEKKTSDAEEPSESFFLGTADTEAAAASVVIGGEITAIPLTKSQASAAGDKEQQENPLSHLDTLLFLAFQHRESRLNQREKSVCLAHSRLWFLGQYIVELALVEYFLQRYPRELPSCIRERVQAVTYKPKLPRYMDSVGLAEIIFKDKADDKVLTKEIRDKLFRAVFWSLIAVSYLSKGMAEVYRLLFEVLQLKPDAKSCQPKLRMRFRDDDHVFPDLEAQRSSWKDVATCKTQENPIFAKPLLYRSCVPPGMKRFQENAWAVNHLPCVLEKLNYPLHAVSEDMMITNTRNDELELGLQLCFLDFTMYKENHPRFSNERLQYLGSKIQDVTMAEKLLVKHLDSPGVWLTERHRKLLLNRLCGVYFREKRLHEHIMYPDERRELVEVQLRLRNRASIAASQALLGLGYAVYGKAEVRRLMFKVFQYQQLKRSTKLQKGIL